MEGYFVGGSVEKILWVLLERERKGEVGREREREKKRERQRERKRG